MATWQKSKFLVFAFTGSVLALCGCGGQTTLPAADDAFLSYFQAAHGLARLLRDAPPAKADENRQEMLSKSLDELEKLQAAVDYPPDKLSRLATEHHATVAECGKVWNELSQRHAKNAQFPALDWPRLKGAFKLCRELNAR